MYIVETINKKLFETDITRNYYYRITRNKMKIFSNNDLQKITAYGIEVEREDIKDGVVINIERECIKTISPYRYKVHNLLKLLSDNMVSPIHLYDILGEYVDKYVVDFEEQNSKVQIL